MSLRPLTLAMVFLLGCGVAEDAPAPANTPTPATCPSMETLAPTTLGLLRGGRLPGLRRLLGEQVDDAQITALLDAALRLLRALDADQLETLLALADDPRIAELLPTVGALIRFVAGEGPGGFRAEVFLDLRRILRTCDGETVLGAVEALLGSPALPRLLAALGDTLRLDLVQQILGSDLEQSLSRPGFTVLVCNILAALIQPGFDVQADVIAPLSGIDLLPLDTPPLSTLLTELGALLAPEAGVLPALGDLVCCDLYGVSRCASVPATATPIPRDPVFTWLMYDLFVSELLDLGALLDQIAGLAADPTIGDALEPVAVVIRQLAVDPDLRRSLLGLVDIVLREDVARAVLPEVALLIEVGAVPELLAVVRAVFQGCDPEMP